jgi:hypothetical protein
MRVAGVSAPETVNHSEGKNPMTCETIDETEHQGHLTTPALELARRPSGPDEVLLLWHPESRRMQLLVHDAATGATFDLEVAPGNAIDAFYHPYVYLAWGDDSVALDQEEPEIVPTSTFSPDEA